MKTYRRFLEPDEQISQLKRLAYEKVDVSLGDVLLRGCHPDGLCRRDGNACRDTSARARPPQPQDRARLSLTRPRVPLESDSRP